MTDGGGVRDQPKVRSAEIAGTGGPQGRGGLAKHRILLELGQGGMANVYLALARGPGDFHKLVVLKVLRAGLAEEAALCDMARGEATIAARLNHANVVQTYEVLNEGVRPVIVMEYLEGQSLHSVMARVKDGSFTLPMALRVLADALAGLHHAHELTDYDGKPFGLVHRDFTLQNIFIGYDGHVKIIDFGIAKRAGAEHDTSSGSVKGKVRYMPPEQIVGEPPLDRRADIFAAGMLLWELVTGSSPWEGQSDIVVINHVINGEIPSLREVAPATPTEILDICAKAIEADREKRYATAAEMEAALEEVLSKMEPRILPRDIGRVVTKSFGEIRASTKRVIEEQIARAERGDPTPGFAVPHLGGIQAQHGGAPATRPARAWLTGLGLAFALAGLALVVLPRWTRPPLATARTPRRRHSEPACPRVQPQTPLPEIVEVHVRAQPLSSVLYFDDERLPGNPAVIQHSGDGTRHVIRAESRGYISRTEEIVVDRASDMVLTLEKAPNVPIGPTVRPAQSEHAPVQPPPPPPSANCNPPYFIDDQGIKRFKPQCI